MPQPNVLPVGLGDGLEFGPAPHYSPAQHSPRRVPDGVKLAPTLSEGSQQAIDEARGAMMRAGIDVDHRAFDVVEATDQTVEAMNDLGLVEDREMATELIAQKMLSLYSALQNEGVHSPVLPFIGLTVSEKGMSFNSLCQRYNLGRRQNPSRNPEAVMSADFKKNYSVANVNRRTLEGQQIYLPSDPIYPLAMIIGDGKNGLSLAKHEVKEQQEYIANHKRKYDESHELSQMLLINPVDYLIISAILRVRGERPLDQGGFGSKTRFITMPGFTARKDGYNINESAIASYETTPVSASYKMYPSYKSKWDGVRPALALKGDLVNDDE